MTDKLLTVIAINLTIITGLLVLQNVPTAQAQVGGVQKIAICNRLGSKCATIIDTTTKPDSLSIYNWDE